MAQIPFIGTQRGRSPNLGAARYLNLYPHQSADGRISILGTPGLVRVASTGNAPVRALYSTGGRLFVVAGESVYSLSQTWVVTHLGQLNTMEGPCSMAWNGSELLIVDGTAGYLFRTANNSFTTLQDMPAARTCCFLDGYFIANKLGSNQFVFSGIYDGRRWDPLDFASAEASPDNIVAVSSTFGYLFLLGASTTEIWYNAGDPDQVFMRVQGMVASSGCAAPFSVAKVGETGNVLVWLSAGEQGQGYAVANAGGSGMERISTAEVEYQWSQYPRFDDAVGYGYTQEGHVFYVLTFPSGGRTWAYDMGTKTWHERQTAGGEHLGRCCAFFVGRHILGSREDGALYAYDLNSYTDAGERIIRELVGPTLGTDEGLLSYRSVQVDMDRGDVAIGLDPQMMLSWSNDAGHTWTDEITGAIGKQGDYTRRVIFRRLGRSFRRTFKLRISDPIRVAINDATVMTE
jgi:hypothetical protein